MKANLLPNASQLDDLNQDNDNNSTDSKFQRKKLIQQNLEFEQGMNLEREQRVREIEADVLDINSVMRELNVLITIQGEHIGKCLNAPNLKYYK